MKRIFALMISAALLLSLAVGCNKTNDNNSSKADDGSALVSSEVSAASPDTATNDSPTLGKETFTVGFDAEFPPYGYQDDNGEYVGFDLELAQEVCDRNGWELIKKPIDWDSKDLELGSGTIDCIWNGFTINGREDEYTWSDPYIDNSQVFVVPADAGISTKSDLAGKIVAVQADSSALAALTDEEDNDENLALAASFADLMEVPDYNTAFMNLEAGAVDAIAMDVGVAKYQIESRGDGFIILDETLAAEVYAVGFKKGNTELRDAVQKSLDEMFADGTVQNVAEKWSLQDCIITDK